MLSNIHISEITLSEVTSSFVFGADGLELLTDSNFLIEDISITNSNTRFMHLSTIVNPKISGITFDIIDLKYNDSSFGDADDPITLFKLYELSSDSDIRITLTNIEFKGLEYGRKEGHLFEFKQQTINEVTVNNLTVEDTVNAHILIRPDNKVINVTPTRVTINGIEVNNMNAYFSSFISMYDGAQLKVIGGTFQRSFSFNEGAILYLGQSD